jgi:hypothetical protein
MRSIDQLPSREMLPQFVVEHLDKIGAAVAAGTDATDQPAFRSIVPSPCKEKSGWRLPVIGPAEIAQHAFRVGTIPNPAVYEDIVRRFEKGEAT